MTERISRKKFRYIREFDAKVEVLPPAPMGQEYKPFFGEPVLFPETGDDPIAIYIGGFGYTRIQYYVGQELNLIRTLSPLSVFPSYLKKRDARIRINLEAKQANQIIDDERRC